MYQTVGYLTPPQGAVGWQDYGGSESGLGQAQWPLGWQDYGQAQWALGQQRAAQQAAALAQQSSLVESQIPLRPPVPTPGPSALNEPFLITPGGQGAAPALLTVNTVTVLSEVFAFVIPTGINIEFNPMDKEQEIVFEPFATSGTTDGDFLVGELDVILRSATGGRQIRVHHSHTVWHRSTRNISSVGNLRRWHQYIVGTPGDSVIFRFRSPTLMDVTAGTSILAARTRNVVI